MSAAQSAPAATFSPSHYPSIPHHYQTCHTRARLDCVGNQGVDQRDEKEQSIQRLCCAARLVANQNLIPDCERHASPTLANNHASKHQTPQNMTYVYRSCHRVQSGTSHPPKKIWCVCPSLFPLSHSIRGQLSHVTCDLTSCVCCFVSQ